MAEEAFEGMGKPKERAPSTLVGETIVVTYYNAPNVPLLREHYEGLPHRLEKEHIDPHIPWLYGFKLDFRFR